MKKAYIHKLSNGFAANFFKNQT